MKKLTRRMIAEAFVTEYGKASSPEARRAVVESLAAVLLEERMTDQVDVVLRDIIQAQTKATGTLSAELTSRFSLTDTLLEEVAEQLRRLTGARQVVFDQTQDEHLLGGVRVQTPTTQLDLSLNRRLDDFAAAALRTS